MSETMRGRLHEILDCFECTHETLDPILAALANPTDAMVRAACDSAEKTRIDWENSGKDAYGHIAVDETVVMRAAVAAAIRKAGEAS